MYLRIVAIPLFAAICLGSPAIAGTSPDEEQMVRGRGARDRSGADGSGTATRGGGSADGERRAGGSPGRRDDGGASRPTARRGDGERPAGRSDAPVARTDRPSDRGDRDAGRTARGDGQRVAVPREPDRYYGRDRDRDSSRVVVRDRDRRDINIINIGRSYGPRYYAPVHYDRWARTYYRWSPVRYAPWGLIYGSIGFSSYGFYGGWADPVYSSYYGYRPYAYGHRSGFDIGGVRLKIRPRDAQVYVDGYYAGLVDDFDGTFQSLRLEAGGHKIEIHMPGYEDLELDVHVQPGRTVTLHEDLRPRP